MGEDLSIKPERTQSMSVFRPSIKEYIVGIVMFEAVVKLLC
jgi:hypothetical protein